MLNAKAEARKQAIQKAINWIEEKPLFLDTETTGLSNTDEIVEIAIIDHDGRTLLNEFVKPARRIPLEAILIHGINDGMVANSLSWPILWATQVRPLVFGKSIGIYNASFDLRMMRQSNTPNPAVLNSLRTFDILVLYASFYGEWDTTRRSYRYQSLEKAGKQCNIALPNAHRALADAILAREVLLYMANAGW